MYFCRKLPSVFLRKRDHMQPVKKEKMYTYDRDIICLPQSYVGKDESISIPRGAPTRNYLAKHGLIGKIRLSWRKKFLKKFTRYLLMRKSKI